MLLLELPAGAGESQRQKENRSEHNMNPDPARQQKNAMDRRYGPWRSVIFLAVEFY
jgi:hypothetical protein